MFCFCIFPHLILKKARDVLVLNVWTANVGSSFEGHFTVYKGNLPPLIFFSSSLFSSCSVNSYVISFQRNKCVFGLKWRKNNEKMALKMGHIRCLIKCLKGNCMFLSSSWILLWSLFLYFRAFWLNNFINPPIYNVSFLLVIFIIYEHNVYCINKYAECIYKQRTLAFIFPCPIKGRAAIREGFPSQCVMPFQMFLIKGQSKIGG